MPEGALCGFPIVSVLDAQDVAAFGGFIPANALAGKDSMKLMVLGNDDRIELVSLFDNLGKGRPARPLSA